MNTLSLIKLIEKINEKMNERFFIHLGIQEEYLGINHKYNIEGQKLIDSHIDSRLIGCLNNEINNVLLALFNAIIENHNVAVVTLQYNKIVTNNNSVSHNVKLDFTISLAEDTNSKLFSLINLEIINEICDNGNTIKLDISSEDNYNEMSDSIHKMKVMDYHMNKDTLNFDFVDIISEINDGIANIVHFVKLGYINNLRGLLDSIYVNTDVNRAKKVLDALLDSHELNCNNDDSTTVLTDIINF